VDRCPKKLAADDHAETPKGSNDQIFYQGEERGDLAYFRKVAKENCHVAAWLRFARMTHITEEEALDLRFARGPRGNFTTLKLKDFQNLACAEGIPPWIPPREDLIDNKVSAAP
jgi:inner membrane protein